MIARGIAAAAAVAAAGWLVIACADRVYGPGAETVVPFAIGEDRRAALAAALSFAGRREALDVLDDREGAARLAAAVARLADHIVRNDLIDARIALGVARATLAELQQRSSPSTSGMAELESVSLALDHAALLAAGDPALALYAPPP